MQNTVKLDTYGNHLKAAEIKWMTVRLNKTSKEAFASLPQELKESFNKTTGE